MSEPPRGLRAVIRRIRHDQATLAGQNARNLNRAENAGSVLPSERRRTEDVLALTWLERAVLTFSVGMVAFYLSLLLHWP
jgi:hypothetical protein